MGPGKFWMVVKDGSHCTSKRHESREEALCEARRLTLKEKQSFYVLEAVVLVELESPPTRDVYLTI